MKGSLDRLMKLKGLYFDWKQNSPLWKGNPPKGKEVGFIAQHVEEHVPEVVKLTEDGIYNIEYGSLVSLALSSIKEQEYRIQDIQKRINILKELTSNG